MNTQLIRFKRLHPDAKIPSRAHDTDFGYDVTAVSCVEVAPNVYKYGLGFALQIVRPNYRKYETNVAVSFRPRSSVWKTGMVLSNAVGTVDEGFTGEISAVYYHVMPDMPRYQVGDRVGQIYFCETDIVRFEEVEELDATERGAGAYGSTGK